MKRNQADIEFSKFIRLRDAEWGEYCRCVTCQKPIQWKYEADCGHFQTRDRPMTRFNELNCHAQCKACNNHNKGEQYRHGREIDKKYGDGVADELEELAGIRGQKIHTKISLMAIASKYRKKAKELAKEKGLIL